MNDAERIRELEQALAGLVGCIDESAADRGPPITRGSMMAQVCKVLRTTGQYARAVDVLNRVGPGARDASEQARCVRVVIGATGQTFSLTGLPAELVALIAATSLSERSLRLLLMLVAIEPTFARMRTGRLEVDVSRGKLHPYLRESLPRVDFDEAGV